MCLLLISLGIVVTAGLLALRWPRVGVLATVLGCALGLVPAVMATFGAPSETLRLAWSVPYGAFYLELDSLSGFFLMPVFCLSAVSAIYGIEYFAARHGKRAIGGSWLFFNLLIVSMAMVVLARNGVLFLIAWETMAITSFFLVTLEHDQESVRKAGWTYLIASHLGTAF